MLVLTRSKAVQACTTAKITQMVLQRCAKEAAVLVN